MRHCCDVLKSYLQIKCSHSGITIIPVGKQLKDAELQNLVVFLFVNEHHNSSCEFCDIDNT